MGRHKTVVLAICGSLGIVLGALLLCLNRHSRETAPTAPTQSHVIEAQTEYNQAVRSKLVGGGLLRLDSMGIKNSVPAAYNDSTPLIEIRTFVRQLDGTVRPLYLYSLGLQAQQHFKGSGSRTVKGYGLRTGLASKEGGLSYLIWDTEYEAAGTYHLPEDPNYITRGRTATVRFRTPVRIAPGEICRVDLILVDRIEEREAAEQARIAQEERARVEEEEKITLQFSQFPGHEEPGKWQVGYHDGDRGGLFERAEDGTFVLKGPNALGGDIVVYYHDVEDSLHPWLYVANVGKRTLQLPADASIVVSERDMIPIRVSLAQIDPNILSQVVMVGFWTSADAKLPLLGRMLRPEDRQDLQANDWQIDMKVRPGTYFVKLVKDEKTRLDIGVVDISSEAGKTYALEGTKINAAGGL